MIDGIVEVYDGVALFMHACITESKKKMIYTHHE